MQLLQLGHLGMPPALRFPAEFEGAYLVTISPESGLSFPFRIFFMILDELEKEQKENPAGDGFYHNRESLLKAYGEERLFGLQAGAWSFDTFHSFIKDECSSEDNIFMGDRGAEPAFPWMYPCFCVIHDHEEADQPAVDYLWTAKRAQNRKTRYPKP